MKKLTLFSLFTLSAILAACGDPIASSSLVSSEVPSLSSTSDVVSNPTSSFSSETTSRLLVSEMMEDMEAGNYTMTFSMDEIDIYYYEVAFPLIFGSLFNPDVNEAVDFYVDLTNEESPVMYTQAENNQWLAAPLDPFSGLFLLAPLSFLDPTVINDAWFTFDEVEGVYVLDPNHFDDLFTGVDSTDEMDEVTIHGDPITGEIQIIVTSTHPDDASLTERVIISYTEIGTTQVSLPTDLLDYPTYFLDTILTGSENHTFLYTVDEFNPVTEETVFVTETMGQRNGDEYLLTDYETFDQTYVNALEDGTYEQITSVLGANTLTTIDENTYDQFVSDFYPMNGLALEKAWIDLQQPTLNPDLNVAMYPLRPDAIPALINNPFFDGITNVIGNVLFYESAFTGPLVNITLEFEKETTYYHAEFALLYFDFTTIHPPVISESSSFLDIFNVVQSIQNYQVSQTFAEGELYTNDLFALRDGFNFELHDFSMENLPPLYLEWDGMQYLQWTYDDTAMMYTNQIIDEATYQALSLDRFFVDLSTIDPLDDLSVDSEWGGYQLDPSMYPTVLRDDILANYTIENVNFDAYGSLDDFASLYVNIEATNNTTSETAIFMMALSGIGETEVILPDDNGNSGLLSLDTFQALFMDGITSGLGSLFRTNDDESDVSLLFFGFNETSAIAVDFIAPENEKVELWQRNDILLYDQYIGAIGTPLTNPLMFEENDFLAFKDGLPSIDILALTSQEISPANMVPFIGGYEIEAAFLEEHSHNILQEGDVIQSAYLVMYEDESIFSVSIHVVNNNEDYFIEFELGALNETFDLKDLIENFD
jgi:hypothetical protein